VVGRGVELARSRGLNCGVLRAWESLMFGCVFELPCDTLQFRVHYCSSFEHCFEYAHLVM